MYDALPDIAAHRRGRRHRRWFLPGPPTRPRPQLLGQLRAHHVNPGAFLRLTKMIHDIDVRRCCPDPRTDPGDPAAGRPHHAALPRPLPGLHIPGARYFERPGDHSLTFARSGDSGALFAEIAGFLADVSHSGDPDRVLATILYTETVGGRVNAVQVEPRTRTTWSGAAEAG